MISAPRGRRRPGRDGLRREAEEGRALAKIARAHEALALAALQREARDGGWG